MFVTVTEEKLLFKFIFTFFYFWSQIVTRFSWLCAENTQWKHAQFYSKLWSRGRSEISYDIYFLRHESFFRFFKSLTSLPNPFFKWNIYKTCEKQWLLSSWRKRYNHWYKQNIAFFVLVYYFHHIKNTLKCKFLFTPTSSSQKRFTGIKVSIFGGCHTRIK